MILLKRFFIISLVFFTSISSTFAQNQIVYLDLDNVVYNTLAGKSLIKKLETSKKDALLKFEKKEKELKKTEDEINRQKNILSEDELKKKLVGFRKEVSRFRQDRQKVINEFNQKKKKWV